MSKEDLGHPHVILTANADHVFSINHPMSSPKSVNDLKMFAKEGDRRSNHAQIGELDFISHRH